ncbi:MAG: hypothetical protein ABW061_11375 [Polyangiaceae bacterium]
MKRPRLHSLGLLGVTFALFVAAQAFLLANLGCSSGAVCYRQTDCPTGTSCHSGQCVRAVALGDAGVAGSDGTAGVAGSDGTAGSAGSAGSDGTAGAATAGSGGDGSTTAGSGGI